MKGIEIPFGAKDSELCGWEYTIPEGMEAVVKDGKVIVRRKESEDERVRKAALEGIEYLEHKLGWDFIGDTDILNVKEYLERQKEQKPNYCHHEVDETGWTEEYRKAYYDGWNNCNMQHSQLQAEQKPAEWSEEDEKMLEVISYKMSQHQGNDDRSLFTPDEVEFIDGMEDKLKSLRPQPKSIISDTDKSNLKDVPAIIRKSNHPFKENIALVIEKYL